MNDTVVVADGEGYIHWLSQTDGNIVARTQAIKNKSILAAPVVIDNTVYVTAQNGDVASYQLAP